MLHLLEQANKVVQTVVEAVEAQEAPAVDTPTVRKTEKRTKAQEVADSVILDTRIPATRTTGQRVDQA